MNLSECTLGTTVKVVDLQMAGSSRKRLLDLGLMPGTEVQVVRKAPLGDPLVVKFRGYQISFRMSEAKCIEII